MKISKREKATVKNTPCNWVDYGDGVAFELYGTSHPMYAQANIKLMRREFTEDLLNLSDEEGLEQYIKIVGRYLVKGWRGIYDENDDELEYSVDNFVDIVYQVEGLLQWVMEKSEELQITHENQVADTKKKPSKGGNTKG